MFLCIYLSEFWIIKPQSDEYFLAGQIFYCGSNEKWAKWHVFFSPPRIVKCVLLMFRDSYSLFQALTQRRQRKLPVNEDWQLPRKQKRCSFPFLNFFTPSVFDVIYGLEIRYKQFLFEKKSIDNLLLKRNNVCKSNSLLKFPLSNSVSGVVVVCLSFTFHRVQESYKHLVKFSTSDFLDFASSIIQN